MLFLIKSELKHLDELDVEDSVIVLNSLIKITVIITFRFDLRINTYCALMKEQNTKINQIYKKFYKLHFQLTIKKHKTFKIILCL